MVDVERCPADSAALKFCSPHASADALYNERALKFRNCRDDDNDRSAQWTLGIDRFALGQELYPKFAQIIEYLKEMLGTAREAVRRPDQHRVELVTMGVLQQLIKGRTAHFRPADAVINVFMDDLIAVSLRSLLPTELRRS
jgi:hypothetical protein